jgi:hypothetical protein
MLHVTNGSIAVSRLHDLGLSGRIVPWDDVLHEGPVRAGVSDEELRRERAAFLAVSWGDVEGIERSLCARDELLASAAVENDEIVLWFEHDLYDQLQLLQIADRLARMGDARRARVSAILPDDYLTAQSDERLQAWFDQRAAVVDRHWQAAQAAWSAFCAPDPTALNGFAHPGAWPTLRTALHRHLQQFPWLRTGLSRTEAQTLAAVADGPLSLRGTFRASNHEVEDAIFMGDSTWWFHIRPLLTGPHPLLAVVGEPPEDFHHPEWWRDDDAAPRLTLTEAGAAVLAGEADHVALNGINRWLGGVHLVAQGPGDGRASTAPFWRWDQEAGRVRRT